MRYEIDRVNNGYVMKAFEADDPDFYPITKVFADSEDSDLDNKTSLQELLWNIIDNEACYSKHNKYNIEVKVFDEEGDIYEGN